MSITQPTQTDAPRFIPDEPHQSRMRALDLVVAWTALLVIAASGSLARNSTSSPSGSSTRSSGAGPTRYSTPFKSASRSLWAALAFHPATSPSPPR
jgi:hypothetical protein